MRYPGFSTKTFGPRLAWVVLFLLLAPACGLLDPEVGVPREARVLISGSVTAPIEVIVSTDFVQVSNEEGATQVSLTTADTFYTDLSTTYDERYPVAPKNRFFVRVTKPDTASAIVTFRVVRPPCSRRRR